MACAPRGILSALDVAQIKHSPIMTVTTVPLLITAYEVYVVTLVFVQVFLNVGITGLVPPIALEIVAQIGGLEDVSVHCENGIAEDTQVRTVQILYIGIVNIALAEPGKLTGGYAVARSGTAFFLLCGTLNLA